MNSEIALMARSLPITLIFFVNYTFGLTLSNEKDSSVVFLFVFMGVLPLVFVPTLEIELLTA